MSKTSTATDRRRRVTIIDLAAELGVAGGTDSRALNDDPEIAETTRIRVRRATDTLGYRPLAQAEATRVGRARGRGAGMRRRGEDGDPARGH